MKMQSLMKLLALVCFVMLLSACDDSSSSHHDGGTADSAGNGSLTLPESSPVDLKEVSVEVLDNTAEAGANGGFSIDLPEDEIVDATVMLPQREEDSLPTVYLCTTRLPGEEEVNLSKEETAVWLLMNGISRDYLTQAGPPEEVRQVIRENGDAFIQQFVEMIEADPYLLRAENLDNVYDQTYIDAATACKTALQEMMPAESNASQAQSGRMLAAGSPVVLKRLPSQSETTEPPGFYSALGTSDAFMVKPAAEIEDFVIHPDTGNLDNVNVGGKMTGSIQIENDSMIFAQYRVTDLVSGEVIKDIPEGFLSRAFGPDLLGPQGGWSTGFWASTGLYKAKFQSVIVEVYTPGLQGGTWSEYFSGPSMALGCRTLFSNVMIPVISEIIPVNEARAKRVFGFMKDYGFFDIPLDKWTAGDWYGGAKDFIKKVIEKEALSDIVTEFVKDTVTDPEQIAKYISKALVKYSCGAKTVDLVGLGVDLGKLADDVVETSMFIEFQVLFPVSINSLSPATLKKVSDEEDNPVYQLSGTGLDAFDFGGTTYEPAISLKSKNLEGEEIDYDLNPADLSVNEDGTALEFQIPFEWAQEGSDVAAPIYVSLAHHFVDYSGINEVVRVELPEEAAKEKFKIDLVTDIAITSLSEDQVSEYDDLIIYGKEFAPFTMDNRVYFIDRQDQIVEAEVEIGDETYLKAMVPEGLAPGQIRVYVEREDKNVKSNEKVLAMRPKMVVADPESNTHFEDSLEVWLFQEQDYGIYYTIGDGSVKQYSGPITLDQTAHIYPFARATIDGVNYDSVINDFFYYKCASDEELIDGECREKEDDDDTELLTALHKTDVMAFRLHADMVCKSGTTRYVPSNIYPDFTGKLQWNGTSLTAVNTFDSIEGSEEMSAVFSEDGGMITEFRYTKFCEYQDRTVEAEIVIQDIPLDVYYDQRVCYLFEGDASDKIRNFEWSRTYHSDYYQYRNDECLYLEPEPSMRISIDFYPRSMYE